MTAIGIFFFPKSRVPFSAFVDLIAFTNFLVLKRENAIRETGDCVIWCVCTCFLFWSSDKKVEEEKEENKRQARDFPPDAPT